MNGSTMNESPKTCMEQIAPLLKELGAALDAARGLKSPSEEQRESVEADICLTSRSAYFDFYTWLVLHGDVESEAEAELTKLFHESLATMRPGRFRASVESRFEEFRQVCARAKTGKLSSELLSSA